MTSVTHLRVAHPGSAIGFRAASEPDTEYCLIDYTHCCEHDTCWLLDLGSGCAGHDMCIIDTS